MTETPTKHRALTTRTIPAMPHKESPRRVKVQTLLCTVLYMCTINQLAATSPGKVPAITTADSQQDDWRTAERPGGIFSVNCGHEGMSVCTDECFDPDLPRPDWCPESLTTDGCLRNLTKVFITPGTNTDDQLPNICLSMPKVGKDCGIAGKPCCLHPTAGNPSTLVRPMCDASLSCMLPDPVTSLPYGGTNHLAAVLKHPGSRGLLAAELMGTCRSAAPVHEAEAELTIPASSSSTDGQGVNSVLGECGLGRLRCPTKTYCASNEDHLLGGARCVPMPVCGEPYQQCCPPYSNGEPGISSIVDKRAAVPTCSSPDAVCVWRSSLGGFDPSTNNAAVQLLTPPGSASMTIQYPETMCIPNLAKCGQAGEPCCPHAQFAASSSPMFFRLHVCDPGLRCSATISIFKGLKGTKPVLGVCQGAEETCGGLGQKCCTHIDQAGWEWRTCEDGKPGVFCGPGNVCTKCPNTRTEAGMSQAALAALAMPGVGNTC